MRASRCRPSSVVLSLLTAFAVVFALAVPAAAGPRDARGERADVIVVLHDGVDARDAARDAERRERGRVDVVYEHALQGFAGTFSQQAIARFEADHRVAYVERDGEVHKLDQALPTGIDRVNADLHALASIDGLDDRVDVDIAVIDTGVDLNHPDLNVHRSTNCTKEGGGPPWERKVTCEDGAGSDGDGHGTHVAGTAAALDNGQGVVGMAPGARVWGVKVLDDNGSGKYSWVIAGIDWVAAHASEIDVANMSLGGSGYSQAMRDSIANAVNQGVFFAVAAGNSGGDVYGDDGEFHTDDDFVPAAYPEVATISALADSDGTPGGLGGETSYGLDDSFASFSNWSASVVSGNPVTSAGAAIDLLLPGVDITSTYKNGGYATGSGTSMASPHAAGLAALHIAQDGRALDAAGVAAIRQGLIDAAQDQASGNRLAHTETEPDTKPEPLGWAGDATVTETTDVAVWSVSAVSSAVTGDVVSVDVTVDNVGNQDVASDIVVTLHDDTAGTGIDTKTISGGLTAGASTTLTFSWDTTGATTGDHALTASHDLTDDNNGNDSATTTVTIASATTDVAVSSVSAVSSAVTGDVVSVDVTVDNVGNQDVASDIVVTLHDDTAGTGIDTKTISGGLTAGASTTLTFSWDTTGATTGDHALTASHDLTDDNNGNDSATTTVTIAEPSSAVHVGDLDGTSINNGPEWAADVRVLVHNGTHGPLAGVTVTLAYQTERGATGSLSCDTGADGACAVSLSRPKRDGWVRYAVTSVSDASYDPSANHDPDGDSDGTTITIGKP